MNPEARLLLLYPRLFQNNLVEEEEHLCSVCWTLESNVVIMECGHGACLSCIQKESFLPFCCKRCWDFSQLRGMEAGIAMNPEGEGMCEMHREDQKLFCENDKTLLCVTCSKLEDHDNHMHWPIAVAAVGYRKMFQTEMKMLDYSVKKIQEFQFQEREKSLAWAVMWTDHSDITRTIFKDKMEVIWEYLNKKEKMETEKIQDLIMGTDNKKLLKLFRRLKQMEIIQDHEMVEKKKRWEAMMLRFIKFQTDKRKILEEKTQKTNVELLQVIPEWSWEHERNSWRYENDTLFGHPFSSTSLALPEFLLKFQETDLKNKFARNYIEPHLIPFSPDIDDSYFKAVSDFLKYLHTSELLKSCNSCSFFEDEKRIITFIHDSGKTYAVYTSGNFQADCLRMLSFLITTSSQEALCINTITSWTSTFEK